MAGMVLGSEDIGFKKDTDKVPVLIKSIVWCGKLTLNKSRAGYERGALGPPLRRPAERV